MSFESNKAEGVTVQWRPHVFHGELRGRVLDPSPLLPTIAEIVEDTPDLSRHFAVHGEVRLDGHIIPRKLWHCVRPRYRTGHPPPVVSLHIPLHNPGGGGGSGGAQSNPIAMVATIAVLLAAAAVSGGALGIGALVGGFLGTSAAVGGALAGAAIPCRGTSIAIGALPS